ncbi:MAG TPA: DUF1003 domain-containing protein [Burkholderiaceae bacterium]|jgi:uncharacterized membrane protein|nr:DUF1003 domain-containing protein [Burkholderiaceae bacterium]
MDAKKSSSVNASAENIDAETMFDGKDHMGHIDQNIENILSIYLREERNLTYWQRIVETISGAMGQPFCLGVIAIFSIAWVAVNLGLRRFGMAAFDAPPFQWLQGIIGLGAFMTMIVILIKQNRLGKLEERRAHLELQVNLLTEQKTTKLIKLLEELRHDLPMIKDRHDPEAALFQKATNPETVLAALDERLEPGEKKTDVK